MQVKNIGVVGFGLIGGSVGMAIKKYTSCNVLAFDHDRAVIEYVKEKSIADGAFYNDNENINKCDIVFVALYPELTVQFILDNLGNFKENAIVCDLCGVKEFTVNAVSKPSFSKIRYVGAHPMAGKEVGGIYNANADLFNKASLILTPTELTDSDAIREITELGRKIGFSNIVKTTPNKHDKLIAFTSQLPHITSVAYVLQDSFKKCDGFYAGSFKDMARVAKINPNLWTELFKINKETLANQIDEYVGTLLEIKNAIISDNSNDLYDILTKSKELKEWQDENYKN